ncbi:Ig-like domain-containing protein, partial [Butyribacter sp.]|uniref:Ig-like domain-containing protein n=1 Tax=Butyribacter sp. TaxID=2822465 RepID=UPI002A93EC97|nr:Ig-like domain-containing protein [Butyribacter sp.]
MQKMKKNCSKNVFGLLIFLLLMTLSFSNNICENASAKAKLEIKNVSGNCLVVKKGKKFSLKVKKGSYKKITYKSSKKKVAVVDKKGVITAKKNGKTTIKLMNKKKVVKSLKVVVGTPVSKLKSANSIKVYVGSKAKVDFKVYPKNASYKTLAYKISNSDIAKIDKKGGITAVKEGTVKVTATAQDGSNKKSTLTVNVFPVNKYEEIPEKKKEIESKQLENTITLNSKELSDDTDMKVQLSGLIRKDSLNKSYIYIDQRDDENTDTIVSDFKSVKATYYVSYESASEEVNIDVKTTGRKWYISSIPVQIGTTNLKITAELVSGEIIERDVHFTRINNSYVYSANVFKLDENSSEKIYDKTQKELIQEFYDGISEFETNDNGTSDDASDDKLKVIFNEDCWFIKQLKQSTDSRIKKGTIIAINKGSIFLNGFFYRIANYYDNADFIKYPSEKYEVVELEQPNSWDMLTNSREVCFDQSGNIDGNNPVAFSYSDFGTVGSVDRKHRKADGATNNQAFTYNCVKENGIYKLTFNGNVVIYDKDGDSNTTNDQVKVNFTYTIDDLSIENCFEWHPIKDRAILPEQMLMRLNYSEKSNVTVDYSISSDVSLKGALDKIRKKGDGKKELLGINISGIENDDVVLGYVGVNLASVVGNIGDTGLDAIDTPTVVFAIVTNLEGKIELKGQIGHENSCYVMKGTNFQKSDFVGKYGSVADNKVYAAKEEYIESIDRYVQFFDLTGKSKVAPTSDP